MATKTKQEPEVVVRHDPIMYAVKLDDDTIISVEARSHEEAVQKARDTVEAKE